MPTHARREAARAFRSARGVAIPVALAWVGGLGLGGAVLVSAMPVGSGSVPYRDPLMRGGELLPDWHPAWTSGAQTVAQLQSAGAEALFGIVLGLALILCAVALVDVATLVLAHGAGRQPEVVMRAVLGARRGPLLARLLGEGGAVACIMGGLGALGALATLGLLRRSWPLGGEVWGPGAVALRIFAACLGVFALVTLACWLLPMAGVWGKDLRRHLATGGRATPGPGAALLHRCLAVLQLAGSLVVVVSAAMLLRAFAGEEAAPGGAGLDARDTLTLSARLPGTVKPSERAAVYRQALARLRAVPGVVDTSIASPGAWVGLGTTDVALGWHGDRNPERPAITARTRHHTVSAGYFAMLGIPLLAGREFGPEDEAGASRQVVVNEAFAYWVLRTRDPVGRLVQLGRGGLGSDWYRVIGMVGDVRAEAIGVGPEPVPAIYLSAVGHPPEAVAIAVRTRGGDPGMAARVERAARGGDPRLSVTGAVPMERYLRQLGAPLRWLAAVVATLAAATLLLAAVGLHAVISRGVTRRTREIGVRMALGATVRDIVRMVLAESARLVRIGTVIGLMGALAVARLLEVLLRGVEPLDPVPYLGIALLLALVALGAGYGPARRAALLDPQVSLRAE